MPKKKKSREEAYTFFREELGLKASGIAKLFNVSESLLMRHNGNLERYFQIARTILALNRQINERNSN